MLKVYLYVQTYIDLQFVYNHSKFYIGFLKTYVHESMFYMPYM
jgi:hypothetical protein